MLFFNKLCFSNIGGACPLIPSINTILFFLAQPYQTSQQASKNCHDKKNFWSWTAAFFLNKWPRVFCTDNAQCADSEVRNAEVQSSYTVSDSKKKFTLKSVKF